jgi:hypothetical protein
VTRAIHHPQLSWPANAGHGSAQSATRVIFWSQAPIANLINRLRVCCNAETIVTPIFEARAFPIRNIFTVIAAH